jgi:hypothetical protein
MTNPNRVIANMSKRPWTLIHGYYSRPEAMEHAARLKAEGKKVRVTSYKYGSRKSPRRGWNVWLESDDS